MVGILPPPDNYEDMADSYVNPRNCVYQYTSSADSTTSYFNISNLDTYGALCAYTEDAEKERRDRESAEASQRTLLLVAVRSRHEPVFKGRFIRHAARASQPPRFHRKLPCWSTNRCRSLT